MKRDGRHAAARWHGGAAGGTTDPSKTIGSNQNNVIGLQIMSEDQPQEPTPANQDPTAGYHPNSGLEDDMNLFASVWVKIEHLQCDKCDYRTSYKNCLAIHVLGHTDAKPFTCDQCDYKTRYAMSLQRHIFVKHDSKDNETEKPLLPTFRCSVCPYKTHYKWNLCSHQRKHDQSKQFKCPQCDYSTAYKHNHIKHSRVHNKPELSTYYCDKCPFATKTSYKNCLAIHVLGHTDAKPFTCDQCDYKTRYAMSLQRHIFVKHDSKDNETEKPLLPTFRCSVCPYKTHYKWNLCSHQRKHDQSKQFKCPQCDYSTAYKHNHIKHSRVHNKPELSTYYCDKCPFATKYEGQISRHLAKVHFEVSEKASRCEHCNFSTKTKWRLNVHRNRSRQEKPIKCAHCEFESMYRCAFREHKVSHLTSRNNQQWLESLFTNDGSVQIQNVKKDFDGAKGEQALEIMKMCEIRSRFENDVIADQDDDGAKIYDELKTKMNDDPTYYTLNLNHDNKTDVNQSLLNISQQSEHEKNNHYLIDPNCEVEWGNIRVIESPDQDRPFQCITCNYRAKFKASVQRHYQRHHTSHNRPYKCVNCDFCTKTKDQIALHNKRSKSDEILTCKICAFTSVFKCKFQMHEKLHYPFKCVHCEYTCKKKYDIQKHFTMVHLGKGMKCSHCDFKAFRKESLLCHEAIHTGKKPFQCNLCDYASVRRILLENHMIRFHNVKAEEKIIDDSKIESLKVVNVETDGLMDGLELKEKMENYYYINTTAATPLSN
ncbi:Uncharacterized protein OBRU01_21076 [Operophtera brumata]|uniref:C2H2-type domain-containing protein n=1 Tax=Operophtera brumata TaxID=104452 RepID=A0A0L7KM65_OPEBR|nr:Uncharacterized protein OBRU01_21076 [Operophtera brumata]